MPKRFSTFIKLLDQLPDKIKNEPEIQSILRFYQRKEYRKVATIENWMDCAGINGANLTFQIEGETRLMISNKVIMDYQKEQALWPTPKMRK